MPKSEIITGGRVRSIPWGKEKTPEGRIRPTTNYEGIHAGRRLSPWGKRLSPWGKRASPWGKKTRTP